MQIYSNYMQIKTAVIQNLINNGYRPDIDGNYTKSIMDAIFYMLPKYYNDIITSISENDPSKANTISLDKWAAIVGKKRKNLIYGIDVTYDNVNFTLDTSFDNAQTLLGIEVDEIRIPAGLQIYTNNNYTFLTIDDIVFSSSDVNKKYIRVISLDSAINTSIPPNSITRTNLKDHVPTFRALQNYITPHNDRTIEIILDIDSDEDLRKSIFNSFIASGGSNRSSIVEIVKELPGIAYVEVSKVPSSPFVQDIYIIPKTAQLTLMLDSMVSQYIKEKIPPSSIVRISYPNYIPIQINIDWKKRNSDVNSYVTKAIDELVKYINSLSDGDSLDQYNLETILYNISNGVDLKITGIFYGTFDSSYRVKNLIANSYKKVLNKQELFYADTDLIKITEV